MLKILVYIMLMCITLLLAEAIAKLHLLFVCFFILCGVYILSLFKKIKYVTGRRSRGRLQKSSQCSQCSHVNKRS